ncbi:MAG: NAD-dependent epimerase/dehydratase family protein, partial [Planctomycetota bacterium]
MKPERRPVVVVGVGYVGRVLAAELAEEGYEVWGVRRKPEVPAGVTPVAVDATDAEALARALAPLGDREVDVCFLTAPDKGDEDGYRQAYLRILEATGAVLSIRRFLFASSTAVYGDADGDWVDETTPPAPTRFSGEILLEAEALARDVSAEASAVRYGGIYGPTRDRMVRMVRDGKQIASGPTRHGNRIHRDDCAGVMRHLLTLPTVQPVYTAVDHAPAPLIEVQDWLCTQLDVDPGSLVAPERPMRRGGDKRVANQCLVDSGY